MKKTKQFKHFVIQEMGVCNRPTKAEFENSAEPLKGISKFHSIWITKDGELRGSVLSCEECTIRTRCEKCSTTTKAPTTSIFKCITCCRSFSTKAGLARHRTVHKSK